MPTPDYIMGTDECQKRSLKGVPRRLTITVDEYRKALYFTESIKKSYCKFQVLRKTGVVGLIKTSKRSLFSTYSKYYVKDNLVECEPF